MPDDATTILDIVLIGRRVQRFVDGINEPAFHSDEEKHWAVVSQLMLIGEAVGRLSDDFKDDRDGIPWRPIAAMRNRLIHQYDTINWSFVWETATRDVPELLSELEPLVPADESADD